jgi:hypothetical protein
MKPISNKRPASGPRQPRGGIGLLVVYSICMILAAAAFCAFSFVQGAIDLPAHPVRLGNDLEALLIYAGIGAIIFLTIGLPAAYLPFLLILSIGARGGKRGIISCVVGGMVLGVLLTPLSALPFVPFMEPESPTYVARCLQYLGDMTFAGFVGGISFWFLTRGDSKSGIQ